MGRSTGNHRDFRGIGIYEQVASDGFLARVRRFVWSYPEKPARGQPTLLLPVSREPCSPGSGDPVDTSRVY